MKKKTEIKSYFICGMPQKEGCSELDLLGNPNCSGCMFNGACAACGRSDSEMCNRCTERTEDGGKEAEIL